MPILFVPPRPRAGVPKSRAVHNGRVPVTHTGHPPVKADHIVRTKFGPGHISVFRVHVHGERLHVLDRGPLRETVLPPGKRIRPRQP